MDATPEERASLALWKNLMEEVFFFQYHMQLDKHICMSYTIPERKWLIERFVAQKNKENEQMEAERRKAKASAKRR